MWKIKSLLYKKCEVCGTDINKLQKWSNIYWLKEGFRLKCPHCETEYKTNIVISFMGGLYGGELSLFVSVFLLLVLIDWLEELFDMDIDMGILEIFLYLFIVISIINFIIILLLPLHKIEIKGK